MYCGTCVVLPQPVSPATITTWWVLIKLMICGRNSAMGSFARAAAIARICGERCEQSKRNTGQSGNRQQSIKKSSLSLAYRQKSIKKSSLSLVYRQKSIRALSNRQ
eukprot:977266-Prorocentrum_minimum.AAC.1